MKFFARSLAVTVASTLCGLVYLEAAHGDPNQAPAQQPRLAPTTAPDAGSAVASANPGAPLTGADQLASVDQLKSKAFADIRDGQFQQSTQLLERAADLSHDPAVKNMADWTESFEKQHERFVSERHKEYAKAVTEVQLLLKHNDPDYALDAASRAYALSDDKAAFLAEPWEDGLIKTTEDRGAQDDKDQEWLKARRIYADLAALQPAVPLWKDKLKATTRREQLLALYTPDVYKTLVEAEWTEGAKISALLNPTTMPAEAVGPTTKPGDDPAKIADNDAFRADWHEVLHDVKMDMLWDALQDADNQYYRDVDYKELAQGGLEGVRAIATTRGMEKAFPRLADPALKATFLKMIDDEEAKNAAAPDDAEARQILKNTLFHSIRSVDQDTVQIPEEVVVNEFANGAFATLDPFSNMIWPSDLEEFKKTTQGEFSGVGIQIQSDDDGSLRVVSPLEDSPAYKAGIKAGDIITKIDGKNAKGITTTQAVRSITGKSDTMVTLTVQSPDKTVRDFSIRRETIKVASVKGWIHKPGGGWEWFVDPDSKIGYVRLTNFTRDSGLEMDHACDQLKQEGAKAIILDLRGNPGGLLSAATEVANKFLHDGVIVSTHPDRDTGNQPTVATAHPTDDQVDLPLVVLVNQYSASASEIVSGALKDDHRAILVGERTFGKGSVQMLFELDDKEACLKLTTSHYYLPSGRCIHREENSTTWGVDPDVTVEVTPDQMRAQLEARSDQDVLRDATTQPANVSQITSKMMSADPQLSAAVLVLRLELAGAQL
jgi:carboxyl-terminal processing protease